MSRKPFDQVEYVPEVTTVGMYWEDVTGDAFMFTG